MPPALPGSDAAPPVPGGDRPAPFHATGSVANPILAWNAMIARRERKRSNQKAEAAGEATEGILEEGDADVEDGDLAMLEDPPQPVSCEEVLVAVEDQGADVWEGVQMVG